MSRGDLQEMEQSKTAVNANAKPAEACQLPTKISVVLPLRTTSQITILQNLENLRLQPLAM
jgi:hypothetical protein